MKIKPTPKARRFTERERPTAPIPQLGKHHRRRSSKRQPTHKKAYVKYDRSWDHAIPRTNDWGA